MIISIEPGVVHVWHATLSNFFAEESALFDSLNTEEKTRADRFHFSLHRQRYIVARGLLRRLIQRYTGIDAHTILFQLGEKGKPALLGNHLLHFNLSHSHDRVIYAFMLHQEIGIDIEWMGTGEYKENLVQRYFSPIEIQELQQLPIAERHIGFYRLWTRKEAILKAMGTGLAVPLNIFSVSSMLKQQTVLFNLNNQVLQFYVHDYSVDAGYQAALACDQMIVDVVSQCI